MNASTLQETAPAGQELSSADVEQGRLYLQMARDYAIGAIRGLSDAQWTFKPSADRWSIAENVEHMVTVQELILGPIREQLRTAPASSTDRDYRRVDAIVLHQFPNRLSRFQAPEAVRPMGQTGRQAASDRLVKNHERLIQYLESTPDLRQHMRESPPLKAISKGELDSMDGYQWVLAAAAHTNRHTMQILEIKADAKFPEK